MSNFIPCGKQQIDEADIAAVSEVLRSGMLTTGPKVREFEEALAAKVGAKHAVTFSSGTAALHAVYFTRPKTRSKSDYFSNYFCRYCQIKPST